MGGVVSQNARVVARTVCHAMIGAVVDALLRVGKFELEEAHASLLSDALCAVLQLASTACLNSKGILPVLLSKCCGYPPPPRPLQHPSAHGPYSLRDGLHSHIPSLYVRRCRGFFCLSYPRGVAEFHELDSWLETTRQLYQDFHTPWAAFALYSALQQWVESQFRDGVHLSSQWTDGAVVKLDTLCHELLLDQVWDFHRFCW